MPKNTPDPSAPPKDAPKPPTTESKQPPKSQAQLSYEEKLSALRQRVAKEPSVKLLPEEWRELSCPVLEENQFGGVKREGGHEIARHLAAAALHGWDLDAYHARKDDRLLLSREDYESALKAIDKLQTIKVNRTRRSGRVIKDLPIHVPTPHAPALSKYAPDETKKLAGVKPQAAQ